MVRGRKQQMGAEPERAWHRPEYCVTLAKAICVQGLSLLIHSRESCVVPHLPSQRWTLSLRRLCK